MHGKADRCLSGVEGAQRVVRWRAACASLAHGANYVQDGRITKQFKHKAERGKGYARVRAQHHMTEALQRQADRLTAREGRERIDAS
eukprot:2478742-Lingulodinium_polyedra.AAC.1